MKLVVDEVLEVGVEVGLVARLRTPFTCTCTPGRSGQRWMAAGAESAASSSPPPSPADDCRGGVIFVSPSGLRHANTQNTDMVWEDMRKTKHTQYNNKNAAGRVGIQETNFSFWLWDANPERVFKLKNKWVGERYKESGFHYLDAKHVTAVHTQFISCMVYLLGLHSPDERAWASAGFWLVCLVGKCFDIH